MLRRFNRAWSQRVGLLDESYLGQGRSLGASRLLFEMGPEGAGVLDLRRRLGLDSGYLSRLLRGLEEERLVDVRRDPADQRRRVVVRRRRDGGPSPDWRSVRRNAPARSWTRSAPRSVVG